MRAHAGMYVYAAAISQLMKCISVQLLENIHAHALDDALA